MEAFDSVPYGCIEDRATFFVSNVEAFHSVPCACIDG